MKVVPIILKSILGILLELGGRSRALKQPPYTRGRGQGLLKMRPRARRWVSVVIVEHRIKLHQSGIEHGFKSGLELVLVRPVGRSHRGLGVVGGWEVCCCTPGKWFGGAGRV